MSAQRVHSNTAQITYVGFMCGWVGGDIMSYETITRV